MLCHMSNAFLNTIFLGICQCAFKNMLTGKNMFSFYDKVGGSSLFFIIDFEHFSIPFCLAHQRSYSRIKTFW